MADVEQLTGPIAEHGEGPVWFASEQELRWVDMLAGDVLSMAADEAIRRQHVGSVAAALRPRAGGGFVVATERGFALDDGDGSRLQDLGALWTDPGIRMNDGGCDPDGRFYCGTMAYDETPGAGALYRLEVDGTVSTVLTGCTISNGLEWSPDGTRAYYVDTPTRRIDVFDYEGALLQRRPFAVIADSDGSPDGLTVDAAGGVWVALWGGAQVRRYSPSGELDVVVQLPTSRPTACTFGGPSLDTLYITTSSIGVDARQEPAAGALFAAALGFVGRPVRPYGG